MSDKNNSESIKRVLDQARNDWVEAERQRLLSRSIDYAASVHVLLDSAMTMASGGRGGKLITQTYSTVAGELARNAEYTFNIPADEFTKRAKEQAKDE